MGVTAVVPAPLLCGARLPSWAAARAPANERSRPAEPGAAPARPGPTAPALTVKAKCRWSRGCVTGCPPVPAVWVGWLG